LVFRLLHRRDDTSVFIMSNPLVSVIIPTYNRARYLCLAIDSVLKQTYENNEILVIDDGSTDNTGEVIRQYGNRVISIYQKNSGVSAARNAGIMAAKGEWIAFLDDDDEWMPDYLSFQAARVLQNPEACMHMTNSLEVFHDGTKTNTFEVKGITKKFQGNSCLIIERPLQFIIEKHVTALQSIIVKRRVLLKAGLFDYNLRIAEDLDVIARVAIEGALGICDKVLACIYRRNEPFEKCLTSLLFRDRLRSRRCFVLVYKKLILHPEIDELERSAVVDILIRHKRHLGNLLCADGQKIEGREVYRDSLLIKPSIRSLLRYFSSYLPLQFVKRLNRK
jgi:glycosyltransferase involved in cell wall biosynthesis